MLLQFFRPYPGPLYSPVRELCKTTWLFKCCFQFGLLCFQWIFLGCVQVFLCSGSEWLCGPFALSCTELRLLRSCGYCCFVFFTCSYFRDHGYVLSHGFIVNGHGVLVFSSWFFVFMCAFKVITKRKKQKSSLAIVFLESCFLNFFEKNLHFLWLSNLYSYTWFIFIVSWLLLIFFHLLVTIIHLLIM